MEEFQGWDLKKWFLFCSADLEIFDIAFSWFTLSVASLANLSPNSMGATFLNTFSSLAILLIAGFISIYVFLGPYAGERSHQ